MQRYAHAGRSAKGARPCGYLKPHQTPIPVRDGQFDIVNRFRQTDIYGGMGILDSCP